MRSIAPRVSLADCFALGGMGTGDLTPPRILARQGKPVRKRTPSKKKQTTINP